jgi:hemoglobin
MNQQDSLYNLVGGEAGLRSLVDRFYDLLDASPEAATIRRLHPKSLKGSREKFFMFLSGWTGGPSLYIEKHGHPRLRMRHAPFSIGAVERDEWLWCMNKALDESGFDLQVIEHVKTRFIEHVKTRFNEAADFLRNRAEN